MKKFIFPVVLAFTMGLGFSGCGGESSDDLAEEKAKLEEQQKVVDRVKELQMKEKNGTITTEEQKELDDLYAQLEKEGKGGVDPGAVAEGGETPE